jgi:mRNA interferase HigB
MRVVAKPILREFWAEHIDAEVPLLDWYTECKKANWKNPAELKLTFPQTDLVEKCTVFNIGGNKYRLITKINYRAQIIYIPFVLTHSEYDKDKWKEDCRR